MRRSDPLLLIAAALAAVVFFSGLGTLWPLGDAELTLGIEELRPRAQELLARHGIDVDAHQAACRLRVDEPILDHVQQVFGQARAQELIRDQQIMRYRLTFKRHGDPDHVLVGIGGRGRITGWERSLQDDMAGAPADDQRIAVLTAAALADLGLRADDYTTAERATMRRPRRDDLRLVLERELSTDPELREQIELVIADRQVAKAWRSLVVPAAAKRLARERRGPVQGLEILGFVCLTGLGLAAAAVVVTRLARGQVRFRPAAAVTGVVFLLALAADALQHAALFEAWDPLWPRWLAFAIDLSERALGNLAMIVPLFVFLAAADTLDRERPEGQRRGTALWRCLLGTWHDPQVIAGSLRGFLVGCLCGCTLLLAVLALDALAGARVSLQPRGFFLYALNAHWPALATICFFGHIALLEELGYRFFAGTWLERSTGRRWLAIALPAAIYGLTHTGMEFLPPTEPVWARPLAMAAVGCVWGWAFLRYDALTVVLSHLSADLFIFNWPRLAADDRGQVLLAVACIAAPLAPAAVGGLWRLVRRRTPPAP